MPVDENVKRGTDRTSINEFEFNFKKYITFIFWKLKLLSSTTIQSTYILSNHSDQILPLI